MNIESGAVCDASNAGYGIQQGPGRATTTNIGGSFASHGGYASENSVYGHYNAEFKAGSGGGSGSGGGLVEFNIGVETMVDGVVKADGQSVGVNSGAGSGGCVVIRTYDFRGKGVFSATGGKYFL